MKLRERPLQNLKSINWKLAACLFSIGMMLVLWFSTESYMFTGAIRFLVTMDFYSFKQLTFTEMNLPGYVQIQETWDIAGIILNFIKVMLWSAIGGRVLYFLFRKPMTIHA